MYKTYDIPQLMKQYSVWLCFILCSFSSVFSQINNYFVQLGYKLFSDFVLDFTLLKDENPSDSLQIFFVLCNLTYILSNKMCK